MPKIDGLAISVLIHQASSSAMVAVSDSEGVTQRVTRDASGSEKADGSKGTSINSAGCQTTGLPSVNSAGSCFAPLADVNRGAKASFEVSMAAEVMVVLPVQLTSIEPNERGVDEVRRCKGANSSHVDEVESAKTFVSYHNTCLRESTRCEDMKLTK